MGAFRCLCVVALGALSGSAAAGDPPARQPVVEWQWRELDGPLERHVEMVAFSPDGSLLAAGSQDTICVWATETGKLVSRMKLPENQIYHRLAFTADGKTLVSDCREDRLVRFWDVKTGKQSRELAHPEPEGGKPGFSSPFMAFGPGAAVAVNHDWNRRDARAVQVADLAKGKVLAEVKQTVFDWDAWSEVSFAPGGKTFALNGPRNQLRIFETATAKLVKEFRPPGDDKRGGWHRSFVRYSPDGKFLMAQEHTGRVETFDVYRFVVWGVADGKRYWSSEKRGGWISAGNRYLLGDAKTVFDLLTDREVPVGNAPKEDRRLVGMSGDGKWLAFVGPKSEADRGQAIQKLSIYLTPATVLPDPGGLADGRLAPAELDDAWAGAVSDNLFRREHATKVLAAHPGQAVELAGTKLKPVPQAEKDRVADLIKRLDDDDPDVRDKATADLHKVAYQFDAPLMAALKSAKAGEVRNRLLLITRKMTESGPPPELVAELRGIALLEELRTPDARKLLEVIAAGAAGARTTDAAAAALKRTPPPRP